MALFDIDSSTYIGKLYHNLISDVFTDKTPHTAGFM